MQFPLYIVHHITISVHTNPEIPAIVDTFWVMWFSNSQHHVYIHT